MTEKQLFKRLSFQQNRFIGLSKYSFHLAYYGNISCNSHFTIYIHGEDHCVIFNDTYDVLINDLNIKLKRLKDFVDELVKQ